MPDFNIDRLKEQWQAQKVTSQYEYNDIREMLNRKSRNYVKYILGISIAEFLLFFIVNILYFFQKEGSGSFIRIVERLGIQNTSDLQKEYAHLYFVMQLLSLLVTSFFVIRFYINYKKINVEENLKIFILQIIKFRKTVNVFILSNIALFIVFMIAILWFVFHSLSNQGIILESSILKNFIIGVSVSAIVCLIIILIYYKLVYGYFIKRLSRNLEQLKSME